MLCRAASLLLVPALLATRPAAPSDRAYTLTMTTTAVMQLLRQLVFTDAGRAYPCRNNPACSSWGENLALSQPVIAVDGPRLVVAVHVSGTYPINDYIKPEVAGDVTIMVVPVVRDGLVHLTEAQVGTSPNGDMTFRAFIGAFHAQIESLIEQHAVFDLARYLASASRDPNLPPPRIPDLTCLDPGQITVQRVGTQPNPAALLAAVTVHAPAVMPHRQPPAC